MKVFCFKHWIFKDDGECQICEAEEWEKEYTEELENEREV